jgi:Ran GTPase-activating protein (RanGAP) involved in mRNA processing and transport
VRRQLRVHFMQSSPREDRERSEERRARGEQGERGEMEESCDRVVNIAIRALESNPGLLEINTHHMLLPSDACARSFRQDQSRSSIQRLFDALDKNRTLMRLTLADCSVHGPDWWGGFLGRAIAQSVSKTLVHLDLSQNMIGNEGAMVLAPWLETLSSLGFLSMQGCAIGIRGATAIGGVLPRISTLVELRLGDNRFRGEGATQLACGLKLNSSLTSINLCKCYIESMSSGVGEIVEALKTSHILRHLDLGFNNFDARASTMVGEMMENTTSLTRLFLDHCKIDGQGATAIGNALKTNESLEMIDLEMNYVGDAGAKEIARGFARNNTLKDLNLKYCDIELEGCAAISEGMAANSTLTKLYLGHNEIQEVGAIANLVEKSTPLTTLLIGDIGMRSDGVKLLATSLEFNSVLTHLDVSYNDIGNGGVACLSEALSLHPSIKHLNMERCDFGLPGAVAIKKMLERSTTLKSLCISHVEIHHMNIREIATGMCKNRSLENIELSHSLFPVDQFSAESMGLTSNSTPYLKYYDEFSAESMGIAIRDTPYLQHHCTCKMNAISLRKVRVVAGVELN